MTGNATMALDRSGGAAWLNPAGLAGTGQLRVELTGTAFVLQLRDYSRSVVADLPSGRRQLDAPAAEVSSIPAALVFVRHLHPRVTAALGVFVTKFERHDIEGGVDSTEQFPGAQYPLQFSGRTRFSLATQTYRIGPAFGFVVTPRLRLGFGLYVNYSTSQDSSYVTLDGLAVDGNIDPSRIYLTTQSQRRNTWFGGQLIAGVQWNPTGGLHLGMTLRSPVLGFSSTGRISRFSAAIATGSVFPGKQFTFLDEQPQRSAERAQLEPLEVTFGIAYRFAKGAIGFEADLRAPLSVEAFEIDDDLQWNLRLGGQFDLPKRISIGLGVFTDRGAPRRTFFVGDHRANFYGFSAALAFDSVFALKPEPMPRSLVFLTVVSFRYAAGFTDLGGLHYAPTSVDLTQLANLIPATQREIFHSLALQISSSISF